MSADIMDEVGTLVVGEGQLDRARYVASNRFRVQEGKGAAFEKRWAERPSRLAKLDGFRYFTLMRRVEAPEETGVAYACLLYTSPSPRDRTRSRMPSSA